jgi:chromate transporter
MKDARRRRFNVSFPFIVHRSSRIVSPSAVHPSSFIIHRSPALADLSLFFLKLGTLAFGGPAVHIAMMQEELVRRRQWISSDEFLDLLAISNLLPGPSSTELAIFIGYRIGGVRGLLLAGICFILPAFLMVLAIAAGYEKYGHLPSVAGILYGLKPVVLAIVAAALWRLGRTAVKNRYLAGLGLAALALCLAGVSPVLVLAGAGIVSLSGWCVAKRVKARAVIAPAVMPGALAIFLVFLKFGCVVFGSGYVLLAFLRADLVVKHGWLSANQLLDSVAVGQITPGPVFTTATFIGYLLGGMRGAVLATLGIFAPAFVMVGVTGPFVPRLRKASFAPALLGGLNVAAVALMASVTWHLGQSAVVDTTTAVLAAGSLALLLIWKPNPMWLVLVGGIAGWVYARGFNRY